MNWASYILSFCLHVLIILLIWLWPASPPVKLDAPPVMISLVDGAPGGNRTPSSILGAAGQPTSGPRDFAAPAPKAEVAAPAATPPQAEPIKSPPKEAAQDRSPKDEVKEAPRPRPKPDDNAAALLAKKKKEEEAKRRQEERERQQAELKKKEEERREAEQKKKEEERKKAEQKKKEEARKKAEQKKKEEERKKAEQERKEKEKGSVAAALRDARRKASSRVESGDRGTAVEQALQKSAPEYPFVRALASRIIRKRLAARGEAFDSLPEALEKLLAAGCTQVAIQPTHLLYGYEYDKIKAEIAPYLARFSPSFSPVGRTHQKTRLECC